MNESKRRCNNRWKDIRYKAGKCRDCGATCENQTSPRCNKHKRWQQVRMIRNRWFYGLFK